MLNPFACRIRDVSPAGDRTVDCCLLDEEPIGKLFVPPFPITSSKPSKNEQELSK